MSKLKVGLLALSLLSVCFEANAVSDVTHAVSFASKVISEIRNNVSRVPTKSRTIVGSLKAGKSWLFDRGSKVIGHTLKKTHPIWPSLYQYVL